jgi:peptidoglycan/LPS O-acetylase OafA/YrhL
MNFFRINTGHSRIFGLDLLRATAILYVVFGHSAILVPESYKDIIRKITLDGVAIFFVLSGFLIGGILIKIVEKEKPTFPVLLNFWSRRWLRTAPIYFVILSVVLIYTFAFKVERVPDDWYRYFIFTQNFNHRLPLFFAESWSLSIEEWFYLLTPIALFFALKISKASVKTNTGIVLTIGIIAIIGYRLYLFRTLQLNDFEELNLQITRQVLPRLDSIMFGVLAAFTAYYYPKLWNKANYAFIPFIAFIALYYLKFKNPSNISEYSIVWLPIIKSLIVFISLPYLANWKEFRLPTIGKAITFISLISYSMYLTNLTIVIHIFIKHILHGNYLHKHVLPSYWEYEYILFWLVTIVLSYLLYVTIEVPFMQLRNKKIKE